MRQLQCLVFPAQSYVRTLSEVRSRSWQVHLERISSFLLYGEGVWWQKVGSAYKYLDGDEPKLVVDQTSRKVALHVGV